MSWEEEDFEPPVVTSNTAQFEDEDKEEEVKDSWEDEEPKPQPAKKTTTAPTESKKFAQTSTKKKSGKAIQKREQAKEVEQATANKKPLTYEEKLALQKKVEEADMENIKDVFKDNDALFGTDTATTSSTSQSGLDTFKPSSEKDFTKYAEMVAEKITKYDESYHYPHMLKTLLREVTSSMDPDDIKELITTLNVVVNEKIAASKKKKSAPKKKTAVTKKATFEDMVEGEYDMFS
jgi:translation initiation factor 3 subunit J